MIEHEQLQRLIERFHDTTLLVVGDVMLDEYIWGTASRIAQEAPVPVLEITSESQRLGGAANVAHNIRTLGGRAVVGSVVGDDLTGERLREHLHDIGCDTKTLLIDSSRPTTVKTRLIALHQQVARFDRERRHELSQEIAGRLLESIRQVLPSVDGVILEDYGKGVMTGEIVHEVVSLATQTGKIVTVDPKTSHFARYVGVSAITPNHHEAGESLHITIDSREKLLHAGKQLLKNLACEFVLITQGEEGMSLFERHTGIVTSVPTVAQDVYDVTGAGDTVIAALTLGLAAKGAPLDAVLAANAAASVVVGKVGTATANNLELSAALAKMERQHIDLRKEKF